MGKGRPPKIKCLRIAAAWLPCMRCGSSRPGAIPHHSGPGRLSVSRPGRPICAKGLGLHGREHAHSTDAGRHLRRQRPRLVLDQRTLSRRAASFGEGSRVPVSSRVGGDVPRARSDWPRSSPPHRAACAAARSRRGRAETTWHAGQGLLKMQPGTCKTLPEDIAVSVPAKCLDREGGHV